jgi:hypothetical protein
VIPDFCEQNDEPLSPIRIGIWGVTSDLVTVHYV